MKTLGLVDQTLLSAVKDVLASNRVVHGPLTEGAHHLNLNVSDSSRVFVKITRTSDTEGARAVVEVAAASHASTTGLRASKPLVGPVLVRDGDGLDRHVTVFRWMDMCRGPGLRDRAEGAFRLLTQVSVRDPFAGAQRFDLDAYVNRMRRRLAHRDDSTSKSLLRVGESASKTVAELSMGRPLAWSHGDLHLLNIGWGVDGAPILLDWESSCLAPVEIDLGQLLRSVMVDHPGHTPEERQAVASLIQGLADEALDVDWNLVEAVSRFRAASAASRLVVDSFDPRQLESNLRYLDLEVAAHS